VVEGEHDDGGAVSQAELGEDPADVGLDRGLAEEQHGRTVRWQVQEAKQRFSELLRQARDDGPQVVTRPGEEAAVAVDAVYFRALTGQTVEFEDFLMRGPEDDEYADLLDEIRASRTASPSRSPGSVLDED
jgi:prevent-host-death family protein